MERATENLEFQTKLDAIEKQIIEWLIKGVINFNMAENFSAEEKLNGQKIIYINPVDVIKNTHLNHPNFIAIGDCRNIAMAVAGKLEGLNLAQNAQIYYDPDFPHYTVIAEVDGQKVLFDVARRRPIQVPIPLDGTIVESDFYNDIPTQKYEACLDGEVVKLTIYKPSGEIRREHTYLPLESEETDKLIYKRSVLEHQELTAARFSSDPNKTTYERVTCNGARAELREKFQQILQWYAIESDLVEVRID